MEKLYGKKRLRKAEDITAYKNRFEEALQKLPKHNRGGCGLYYLVNNWIVTRGKGEKLSKTQIKNARYGKARNTLFLEALEAIAFEHEVMDKIINNASKNLEKLIMS